MNEIRCEMHDADALKNVAALNELRYRQSMERQCNALLEDMRYRQSLERQYNAWLEDQQNAWPRIMEAIRGNMGLQKTPDKPIWKETKEYWIVVAHQVGPLKLLEIVLKEGYGDE